MKGREEDGKARSRERRRKGNKICNRLLCRNGMKLPLLSYE